jgi:hypothetical protein
MFARPVANLTPMGSVARAFSKYLLTVSRQKFLFTLPLSTGASLITLSLLLNKLSGLYGILALLTGYHLSPFQLSMYIYSLICLGITIFLSKHIKTSSPFHCLALAWLYILDSAINAAYTAAFAVTWFLVLMGTSAQGPGADTIKDTSGFTEPKYNVSSVQVMAAPNVDGVTPGQDAVAGAVPADVPNTGSSSGILDTQSINSIAVIVGLWTIRAYFCLVMLSWARNVVRQYIAVVSVRSGQYSNAGTKGLAEDPFAKGKPEGHGWKGKLGRFMIALGRTYFLGADGDTDDEGWAQSVGRRFGSHKHVAGHELDATASGTGNGLTLSKLDTRPTERERRRRSGTGPPLPEVQAQAAALQVRENKDEESVGLLKLPSQ